jgi:hypothetical protein
MFGFQSFARVEVIGNEFDRGEAEAIAIQVGEFLCELG